MPQNRLKRSTTGHVTVTVFVLILNGFLSNPVESQDRNRGKDRKGARAGERGQGGGRAEGRGGRQRGSSQRQKDGRRGQKTESTRREDGRSRNQSSPKQSVSDDRSNDASRPESARRKLTTQGSTVGGSTSSSFVDRFDVNADGKISRAEIPDGLSRRMFDRLVNQHGLDATKTYGVEQFRAAVGMASSISSSTRLSASSSKRFARRSGPGNSKIYRTLIDLPQEYARYDRDGDGQIGLYEWPRDRIREFVRTDKNDDGFLTLNELN